MNSYSVHQRNASQGQQLILESRESGDDESGVITKTLASPSHPMSSLVSEVASTASSQPALTVPSDAGLGTIIALFLFCFHFHSFQPHFPFPLI
uniref:Transmembrane protein 134 n=1 Tax=Parascaris univalens TaxID=6257 RepID=A0A915BWU6_PARUN